LWRRISTVGAALIAPLRGSNMPLEFKRPWSDEDVERFRDSWVRFVESEMLPHDAEARRLGHVGHELRSRAGELGFLCVDILEEWGGAGGDFRHEAVLHEEMARRALSGMSIGVHSIAAHYLLNHGTDDQKHRYLPRLAKGELVGASRAPDRISRRSARAPSGTATSTQSMARKPSSRMAFSPGW
jgi:alkylation response protein AidB-like acyl-CoA dehydrogenase